MAIANTTGSKNSSDWSSGTSKSTTSFAFTGNLLICHVSWTGGSSSVSTVKWNTTETFTAGTTARQNNGGEYMQSFYLMNPTNTTSTVDVTMASAPSHGGIIANAYSGAGTPTQWSSFGTGTSTSYTCTLTVSANSWINGSCGAQRAVSAGTGTTLREQVTTFFNYGSGDSGGALTAGSRSIQFTYSSVDQGVTYCEIPIASAAGTTYNTGFLLGYISQQ